MFKNFNMFRDENLLPFLPPVQGSLTPTWYFAHTKSWRCAESALSLSTWKFNTCLWQQTTFQPAELTGQLNIFSFVSSMISSLNNLSILCHLILWWILDDSYFEIVWHFLFCSNTNSLGKNKTAIKILVLLIFLFKSERQMSVNSEKKVCSRLFRRYLALSRLCLRIWSNRSGLWAGH